MQKWTRVTLQGESRMRTAGSEAKQLKAKSDMERQLYQLALKLGPVEAKA